MLATSAIFTISSLTRDGFTSNKLTTSVSSHPSLCVKNTEGGFFFFPKYSTSRPYLDLGSTGLGAGPGNAVLSMALKLFVIFRQD